MTTTEVRLERHEVVTDRAYDDVLATMLAALGDASLPQLLADIDTAGSWQQIQERVADAAGEVGLLPFLVLDLGTMVTADPDVVTFRAHRVIAGNPATMESMVRTTPGAGAFAPVTILLFEADDGVHLATTPSRAP